MSDRTREHVLLTVLGVGPKDTTYVWEGRAARSSVAPAALFELLPDVDRPSRVLALCTAEARLESLPPLRARLAPHCPVDALEISAAPTEEAVHACLADLADAVPQGADLTVDVTHGFRHMSFVAYAGVLYLTALRDVRLRGAYYAMLKHDEPSPFFDLRPLVELPQWFHALRVMADTGSAHVVADLVAAAGGDPAGQVGTALRHLATAYGWGLPIELGHRAEQFLGDHVEPLRELLRSQRLPLADELVHELAGVLATQRLGQELSGPHWKQRVRLDRTELARQARIIDGFLARGDYPTVFGLMREWLVLWAMWRLGAERDWLDHHARYRIGRRLHDLSRTPTERLTAEQARVGSAWGALTGLRNHYQHHGFDPNEVLPTEGDTAVSVVLEVWQETLRHVPELPLDLPPVALEGRVLVSPLGTRPGVLFSALHAAGPRQVSTCLVICSAETEGAAREACAAAGFTGDVVPLRLADPFAGVNELGGWVGKADRHLRGTKEVFISVTGGTTLMGVLAERIASRARKVQQVYRFALVDRRPPAAQDADPYQASEVCWLDGPPGREERDDD